MQYLIAGALIAIISLLAGVTIGYRLAKGQAPIAVPQVIQAIIDDMPEPISPHEEAVKTRKVRVKV